jgi:hypothetical protein
MGVTIPEAVLTRADETFKAEAPAEESK